MAPSGRCSTYADKLCANVIEKTFGQRAITQNKGKSLLMKLAEVDDCSVIAPLLLSKLNDKKPKIPPVCLETLRDMAVAFGGRALPVKEIISSLKPVLDGTNGPAREEALKLMVELTRWIGKGPFAALLENFRSAQKSEFDKMCGEQEAAGASTPVVPTVWLRKDRPAPGSETQDMGVKPKAASVGTGDCSREFADEVDLIKRLKATDYAKDVAGEKWSDQQRALQFVIDIIGPVPKIKAGSDVHEIISSCKGFLREGHLQVQLSALKVVGLLADGLRAELSTSARVVSQSVIQKCKEKRLCAEVLIALNLLMKHCMSFDNLYEDVSEIIRNKKTPPHGKSCLIDFVHGILSETPDRVPTDLLKGVADMLLSCCEDSDPKVRDWCSAALTSLMPAVKARGKAAIEAHRTLIALEQTNPRVYKKIQAGMDGTPAVTTGPSSTVSSSGGGGAISGGGSMSSTQPTMKRATAVTAMSASTSSSQDASTVAPSSASSAAPVLKRPSTAPVAGGAPTATTKKNTAATTSVKTANNASTQDDEVEELAMSVDAAQELLSALNVPGWDGVIQEQMTSAKWQDKVEALEAISNTISAQQCGGQYSAALVVYLASKTANFKISNINILKSVIQVACSAAQSAGEIKFSKAAAWKLLENLGDKLSDKKTSGLVGTLLTALCEAISPVFVMKRMKTVMDKTKAPLAHQSFLEWLKDTIKEFGAASFPVQYVGQFLQIELENKMGTVRTAAVEVYGSLYNQLGPRLQSIAMSDDMKPAMKTLLEAEFTKVGYDPASAKAPKGDSTSGGAIPRQDLSSILDKNILSEMSLVEGKNSWQNRKTAMEAVIAACERSGHYLDASKGLVEIARALKTRFGDTQANLKPIAASALSHVIASVEQEQGCKILRAVAAGMIAGLGDNKKSMRDAVISSLQMIVTLGKDRTAAIIADSSPSSIVAPNPVPAEPSLFSVLISPIAEALGSNVIGRIEILTWLVSHTDSVRSTPNNAPGAADKEAWVECVVPCIAAMQDKTGAVRSLAEQFLTSLMAKGIVKKDVLDKATRDLPPSTKRSLQAAIDRMMAAFGTRRVALATAAPAVTAAAPVAPAPSVAAPVAEVVAPKSVVETTPVEVPSVSAKSPLQSQSLQNDDSVTATTVSTVNTGAFKKTSKTKRCDEFYKHHWPVPPEEVGETELSVLRTQWEPLIDKDSEILSLLFPVSKFGPPNQDAAVPAVAELLVQFDISPNVMQHVDLILRWATYAMCMRETAGGLLKVLQFITSVFERIRAEKQILHESEITVVIPHLIEKSGHKSERHKVAFKAALAAAGEVVSPIKLCQLLLAGLGCKNKKTRVVCLEEIQRVVESAGVGALGRTGVKEVASYLDSKDNDVAGRHACLELTYVLYISLGSDSAKLLKLLGELSERSTAMINDRIKQKLKSDHGAAAAGATISSIPSAPAAPGRGNVSPIRPSTIDQLEQVQAAVTTRAPVVNTPVTKRAFALDAKGDGNDIEFGSPFRLEMTPPGNSSSPSIQGVIGASSASSSPAVTNTAPSWSLKNTPRKVDAPSSTVESNDQQLDGIYAEIAVKIDALLAMPSRVTESHPLHDDARESLKLLHAVLLERNHSGNSSAMPADEAALVRQAEPMIYRLLGCFKRAFELSSISSSPLTASVSCGIDLGLVSLALANLHAYVNHPGVPLVLSENCVTAVFAESVRRLMDPSLASAAALSRGGSEQDKENKQSSYGDNSVAQTGSTLLKAINILVLQLASKAHTGLVMCSVLRVLRACIPELNGAIGGGLSEIALMPATSSKALSKLMLKILSDEIKKTSPFNFSNPERYGYYNSAVSNYNQINNHGLDQKFSLKRLLFVLHCLFENHPLESADDVPFCTGKTLVDQIVKAVGGPAIMATLGDLAITADDSLRVPTFSFLTRLCTKFSGITLPCTPTRSMAGGDVATIAGFSSVQFDDGTTTTKVQSSTEKALKHPLYSTIGTIIEEITKTSDKMGPIKRLHAVIKSHPEIDVYEHLQKMSSAFRKFVLDALLKLDEVGESESNATVPSSPGVPPASIHIPSLSGITGGNEAMRILADLKANNAVAGSVSFMPPPPQPKSSLEPEFSTVLLPPARPLSQVSESSLASQQQLANVSSARASLSSIGSSDRLDKIRGSLSSLTASLDLGNISSSAVTSSGSLGGSGDSDLSARLARLRSMTNAATSMPSKVTLPVTAPTSSLPSES